MKSEERGNTLLEIDDAEVFFSGSRDDAPIRAVDGVSLLVREGESLGVVGESGCGKTTLGRAIIRLVPLTGGRIFFQGADVTSLKRRDLREFRRRVQMVFQDPFGALNPRMTVGSSISEVLYVHDICSDVAERMARVEELLSLVGLEREYIARYPHEFSGGQRQRIGIARALALNPSLVIADEPVSALDVSVQVQILNLMKDLQEKMGLSYLFIAHDLAVVRYMCRRLLVMYLGRVVETGGADDLFRRPAHPYTEALLSAVPDVDRALRKDEEGGRRIVLKGDVPSAAARIDGCPFHPRCHRAREVCRKTFPPNVEIAEGRSSLCHFAGEVYDQH